MTIIYGFLFDSDFINDSSIIDPVFKTGGVCSPSPLAISYFKSPQEFPDERTSRATDLNALLTAVPKLIVDSNQFQQFLTDVQDTWSSTERENFFALLDLLFFDYNANATAEAVETNLETISQYVQNTYVYSNTTTSATAYLSTSVTITVPDYVSFTYKIANDTEYQFCIYASNVVFLTNYPISTIAAVVPPLPISQLYTLDLVSGIANVFQTALASATLSQQTLQSYIASGEYSGFVSQNVTFVDTNNNTTVVQFNILYNGAVPGVIAVRSAISELLINSGVGTEAGWEARAPSLFVTQLWYLIPLWENKTSLVSSYVYPNIVPMTTIENDAEKFLYDMESGFITANLDVVTSYYNNITMAAVPDVDNDPTRLSLAAEHPTFQDVSPTNATFNYMTTATQQFASLLGSALSVAAGNANTNTALTMYTATGDNRTYVTFSVSDCEYYVATSTTYLALIDATSS